MSRWIHVIYTIPTHLAHKVFRCSRTALDTSTYTVSCPLRPQTWTQNSMTGVSDISIDISSHWEIFRQPPDVELYIPGVAFRGRNDLHAPNVIQAIIKPTTLKRVLVCFHGDVTLSEETTTLFLSETPQAHICSPDTLARLFRPIPRRDLRPLPSPRALSTSRFSGC